MAPWGRSVSRLPSPGTSHTASGHRRFSGTPPGDKPTQKRRITGSPGRGFCFKSQSLSECRLCWLALGLSKERWGGRETKRFPNFCGRGTLSSCSYYSLAGTLGNVAFAMGSRSWPQGSRSERGSVGWRHGSHHYQGPVLSSNPTTACSLLPLSPLLPSSSPGVAS